MGFEMMLGENLDIQIKQDADYPEDLGDLISRLRAEINSLTISLQAGEIDPIVWQAEFERFLVRYHEAAYMTGQGSPVMKTVDLNSVKFYVGSQLEFLDNFRFVIQSADQFMAGWLARAEMYAGGIKKPYWKGKTKVLPLPAMPAEGTACLDNCGCSWDIEIIDEESGDYDAYWIRGKRDSCKTCLERAAQWSPLEIRAGVLITPGRIIV